MEVAQPQTSPPIVIAPDYWTESSRPLASLVFIVPMLMIYELGVVILGPRAVRNGADAWMREGLDLFGFGQYFLLPIATCGILLSWHHISKQRWRVSSHVVWVMWFESVLLAMVLLLIAHLQSRWFTDTLVYIECSTKRPAGPGAFAYVIEYMGAGIYEELLFRLMLLPISITAFRFVGLTPKASLIAGILISSVLFSLAHYRMDFTFLFWDIKKTQGDIFQWFSFVFRFSAGVFFSVLFVYRSFGIAAGCHAIYDILTVLL